MIELCTLGALELTSADSSAVGSVLAQPRRAALLCYLALASPRGFHRRDTLFALFWPEDDAEHARHALRQSVYFLRRALGGKTIVSRGDNELALAPDQLDCDVWAFEAALDQGRPADALALYRGQLLAGFHISAPGRSSSTPPLPCHTSIASIMQSARGTRPAPSGCSALSPGLPPRAPTWPGIAS